MHPILAQDENRLATSAGDWKPGTSGDVLPQVTSGGDPDWATFGNVEYQIITILAAVAAAFRQLLSKLLVTKQEQMRFKKILKLNMESCTGTFIFSFIHLYSYLYF